MSLNSDHALETYKSLIGISTEALKALQLINGGAIVAILAYLGQAANDAQRAAEMRQPLVLFISGLSLSVLVSIGSYMTQSAIPPN